MRILETDLGACDLAAVDIVRKTPQVHNPGGGLTPVAKEPTASLIFSNGCIEHTTLPFSEVFKAWSAVKQAEEHPIETTNPNAAHYSS